MNCPILKKLLMASLIFYVVETNTYYIGIFLHD